MTMKTLKRVKRRAISVLMTGALVATMLTGCKALQDKLGFKIKNDTIQDMDYGPLTTSLTQGQIDLGAAALCATDERKEVMNFSDIYYDAGIIVAVGKDNNDIKSVDDLTDGKYKVAVQTGTIAYEYATSKLPEKCLQSFDSQALAYKAVEGGQADLRCTGYLLFN